LIQLTQQINFSVIILTQRAIAGMASMRSGG